MIVRDKSFKVFGPVHLRVHLGQGVFLPEGGWTVEVNTEGEKGTAGRRGLCTHRPTGCWSPQSSLRAASSPGRQGSCVRAGRRHGPLNAKCWSPQSSERAASSPGRQGSRARASSRQGSPRPTLRPCKRAPTPAPWGCLHPLPPRLVRAPRSQLRRLRGCHAAARLRTTSRTAAPPGPRAPHASGRFQCAPTPLPTPRSTAPPPAPHRIAVCGVGMPTPACAPPPTPLPAPAPAPPAWPRPPSPSAPSPVTG